MKGWHLDRAYAVLSRAIAALLAGPRRLARIPTIASAFTTARQLAQRLFAEEQGAHDDEHIMVWG